VADDGNWNIEEIERAFSAAMAERGYGDHHVPANSGWNRFAFPDNRPGRDSGSAILDVGETIVGTVRDFRVDEPSIFTWQPNGAIDPAILAAMSRSFVELKLLPAEQPLAQYITDRFLPKK